METLPIARDEFREGGEDRKGTGKKEDAAGIVHLRTGNSAEYPYQENCDSVSFWGDPARGGYVITSL